ncbi:MAG: hypothetical protein DRI86_01445 [Bacteroidetes bacterium]|nr:MAG: hypothetical protein DRI86_01445 [Bacteroidota bacterium]
MDPTEKGWIAKFIEKRCDNFEFQVNDKLSFEEELYKHLQATGVLYGHPIKLPYNFIETDEFPIKERLEVIFAESLFSTGLLYNSYYNPTYENIENIIDELNIFYLKLYPKIDKTKLFEAKPKTKFEKLEKILQNRVQVKKEWNTNFWRGFFQNILLFTDIIIYIKYLESDKSLSSEDLQNLNKDLQWNIIYLLSITIHITQSESDDNINYYQYFVDSTSFSKEEKEKAVAVIQDNNINKVYEFLDKSNWLTNKYFLELALLSIWADHKVKLSEKVFIEKLSSNLNLEHLDVVASTLAIEAFVLNNWTKIHYLQTKQNYLVLSKRLTQRMTLLSRKYINEIKQEIEENKELIQLLNTSQKRPLSIEEKNTVRQQLVDVLKTIPTFIILALPGAFLTVPILMKILPKEALPSSFDPNKLSPIITAKGKNRIIEG